MDESEKHIIEEFNSDITQKLYVEEAKKGLWKSEEILIKKYFRPNSSILDIGCGTGRTTIPLFRMGYEITGIDFSQKMIENAIIIAGNSELKINYKICNATDLNFPSGSFDNALFSNNGWTQIPFRKKRIEALTETYRILKRGGYFIFTVNSRNMFGKYFSFWTNQWIRIKALKYLGYKTAGYEFGDKFFEDRGRGKQYIHIPSVREVKKDIGSTLFKLIYYRKANSIIGNESLDDSTVFFVCQKT